MLCWFLPYMNVNQPQVYRCPLPFEPPPNPIPLLEVVTEHQVELSVLYSNAPLAICFMCSNVSVSMLLSQLVLPSLPHTVSTSLFSMSVTLFLPCTQAHQYHLSKFHIHVLLNDICFSLSDLLILKNMHLKLHELWHLTHTQTHILNIQQCRWKMHSQKLL